MLKKEKEKKEKKPIGMLYKVSKSFGQEPRGPNLYVMLRFSCTTSENQNKGIEEAQLPYRSQIKLTNFFSQI